MNRHVLVAGDSDIVLMLTDCLEALGCSVRSAGDGQRALEIRRSYLARMLKHRPGGGKGRGGVP